MTCRGGVDKKQGADFGKLARLGPRGWALGRWLTIQYFFFQFSPIPVSEASGTDPKL